MENKHDVFVSFSFKDQKDADYVVGKLYSDYNISYWICTNEILAGEHYKTVIRDAIKDSKIVLLMQSAHSIASKEVPKEISIALDRHKTVIPFVLDEAELDGDLEYDLLAVHRIDATKPPIDDRIEELSRHIFAVLNKKSEKESTWLGNFRQFKLLSTPSITPKKVFCGREDVLKEIENNFASGENVQFLHGIGGIGKTQIAKQFAKLHKNDYDTIVFATYNESLKNMLIADAPFTLYPEMARYTLSNGEKESDDAFFERKLNMLKKISSEKTLIVIDNFDVENDSDLKDFASGPYHILITTRNDFSRFYPTIKINALDKIEDLKEIFMKNYDGYDVEEDDEYLEELIELINRHTYTVELLAQHMENSGQTTKEMIEALKKEGILSLSEEISAEDMKKQTAYENLLKMFRLFALSEEEKQVLMYLSLMPTEGVNVRNFREWANLDSTKIIKDLETRSWLFKNTEGIALHPIIKEVIKHELKPSAENCASFIERFTSTIEDKKTWGLKKSEKDRLATIARGVLQNFGLESATADLYYHAQSLFSFAVDTKFAVTLAKRIYDFYLQEKGEESFETARSAFKIGWVHSFDSSLENAHENACKWLEKADELFGKVSLTTPDEKSRHTMTITNISKQYMYKFSKTKDVADYEKAKEYGEKALRHAIESFSPGEFHYAKIAGAHMQLAELMLCAGKYDECLEYSEKAAEVLLSLFSENDIDIMYVYFLKAAAYLGKKDCEKALIFAKKAADGYTEYFGMSHVRNYLSLNLLGDSLFALNRFNEAKEAYENSKKVAELLYAPGALEIKAAEEKLEKCKEN